MTEQAISRYHPSLDANALHEWARAAQKEMDRLRFEADAAKAEAARMRWVANESQDWNWLTANEEADEAGRERLDNTHMQALVDAVAACPFNEGAQVVPNRSLPPMEFAYTNWRGETSVRRAIPVRTVWTSSAWHPDPQWVLEAFDVERQAMRSFAIQDMEIGNAIGTLQLHDAQMQAKGLRDFADHLEKHNPGNTMVKLQVVEPMHRRADRLEESGIHSEQSQEA